MDSTWRCTDHGSVLPLNVFHRIDDAVLQHVRTHAEVPLWLPEPPPSGWKMSGLATVGDARSRLRATVSCFDGPAPLGGDGQWLVVAEEPGIGLGSTYAGAADVADLVTSGPPEAKVHAHGHPTSLWVVPDSAQDRCAYVGEANGVWLWIVCFPPDAGYALLEDLTLTDARARFGGELSFAGTASRLRPGTHL